MARSGSGLAHSGKRLSIGYIEEAEVFHWGGQSETATPPAAVFAKDQGGVFILFKTLRPKPLIESGGRRESRQDTA